jgi:hypothetical protein
MIREICHCPYCPVGIVALDDARQLIVFNPDRLANAPCRHLAFMSGALSVADSPDAYRTRMAFKWSWTYGDEVRHSSFERKPAALVKHLEHLAFDVLFGDREGLGYSVTGATTVQREERCPGTGEFPLKADDGRELVGILDGWGIYCPDPARFLARVKEEFSREMEADKPDSQASAA